VLVLRLLCLLSCTAGGLPKKHGDSLRSEFLAAYGHQHLLTLNHLERAGWFWCSGWFAHSGCGIKH
jgi:hypothetical protein